MADRNGRSGSAIRRRTKVRTMRFTPEEDAAIEQMAAAYGCSFSELVRRALDKGPRPMRLSKIQEQAVARLLRELAKLKAEARKHGSNLNQIAHHLNAGRPMDRLQRSLDDTLDAVTTFYERTWRIAACMHAGARVRARS